MRSRAATHGDVATLDIVLVSACMCTLTTCMTTHVRNHHAHPRKGANLERIQSQILAETQKKANAHKLGLVHIGPLDLQRLLRHGAH